RIHLPSVLLSHAHWFLSSFSRHLLSFSLRCFSVHCSRDHRDLHSFPTRRSSDLPGLKASRTTLTPALTSGKEPLRILLAGGERRDRKSTRLNSSHVSISYAVFCLKKKKLKYRHVSPSNAHDSYRKTQHRPSTHRP